MTISVIDFNGDVTLTHASNITEDTDDQIDIEIAGTDDFQFTADTLAKRIIIPIKTLILPKDLAEKRRAEEVSKWKTSTQFTIK